MADTTLVSVSVSIGSKQAVSWSILPVERTCTVEKLCRGIFSGEISDIDAIEEANNPFLNSNFKYEVSVGKSKTTAMDTVFPSIKVSEIVDLFGRYFLINIYERKVEAATSIETMDKRKSAFAVLLESRERLVLPPKPSSKNKRDLLTNMVIDWLQDLELGFTPDALDSFGKNFVTTLGNTLWYIDPYVPTMDDRSFAVPQALDRFFGMNDPKSRKQKLQPIESLKLMEHATNLDNLLELPFIQHERWKAVKALLTDLADCLHKYLNYLQMKRQEMAENRSLDHLVRPPSEAESLMLIHPNTNVNPTCTARYKPLVDFINAATYNTALCIDHFVPDNMSFDRRYYFKCLPSSIPLKVYIYSYAYGNNLGTYHFIWKVDPAMDPNEILAKNTSIINEIKESMPKYHTREMKKKFIDTCGRICNMKSTYLRTIYKRLSGDNSVSEDVVSKNVDERVQAAFEMEDPNIVVDLRKHNEGRPSEYSVFFEKCKMYLENVVEKVCDERRHEDKLTYLATAISIPDLRNEIAKTCEENTPIPSEQWLRFQFAPQNPHAASSFRYTGNLNIKYMVQSRVFRKKHEDDHYCAALFRYLREMAIEHKDYATFIAMDDKHYCKVGEPGNPLAAVDRGRQVLIAGDKVLAASDHDFAKVSIIPSVTMEIQIPDNITDSFYRGQVHVGLKDHVFESSSPTRHMAELKQILTSNGNAGVNPILLLYTDGGPDHRVNFMSVKASLVCLFKALDLDMLVAVRTAPNASWRNPPERIMSILNLALNCVGLKRQEMSEEYENYIKSCNTMNDIRASAGKHEGLREAFGDSLEPVKILLSGLFSRLSLKGKKFKIFQAATDEEISSLWSFIREVDGSIGEDDKLASDLKGKKSLEKFLDHCCLSRHYFFAIKKCGAEDCDICSPPRSPPEVFASLHQIPDPVADGDHYKPFHELYGKVNTSEAHRPSLKKEKAKTLTDFSKQKLPISTTAQTANTVKTTVSCTECGKPRVLYSQKALSVSEKQILSRFLQFFQYSCGASIQDLIHENAPRVSKVLERVFVRGLRCEDDIETPYFSSKAFVDICVKCGSKHNLQKGDGTYPMCQNCRDKFAPISADARKKRASSSNIANFAKKSKK